MKWWSSFFMNSKVRFGIIFTQKEGIFFLLWKKNSNLATKKNEAKYVIISPNCRRFIVITSNQKFGNDLQITSLMIRLIFQHLSFLYRTCSLFLFLLWKVENEHTLRLGFFLFFWLFVIAWLIARKCWTSFFAKRNRLKEKIIQPENVITSTGW